MENRLAENTTRLQEERAKSSSDAVTVEELEKTLKESSKQAIELERRIQTLTTSLTSLEKVT